MCSIKVRHWQKSVLGILSWFGCLNSHRFSYILAWLAAVLRGNIATAEETWVNEPVSDLLPLWGDSSGCDNDQGL